MEGEVEEEEVWVVMAAEMGPADAVRQAEG